MAPPFGEDQGSADSIGKSWQREIFPQTKEWKIGEYFVYFLFFILYGWRKDPLSSHRRLIQSFLSY